MIFGRKIMQRGHRSALADSALVLRYFEKACCRGEDEMKRLWCKSRKTFRVKKSVQALGLFNTA